METRDYGQDQELIKQFFRDVTDVDEDGQILPKYQIDLTKVANRDSDHLYVDIADLEQFNGDLAERVKGNTSRYSKIFLKALDDILPTHKTKEPENKDPMDIFIQQRLLIKERNQRAQPNATAEEAPSQQNIRNQQVDIEGSYPPDLIRRAEVSFKPPSLHAIPIRSVKADKIGKFVTVRGIVTRATDVKQKVTIVTYTCDLCGYESFQPVKGKDFTPLFECSSAACKSNKALGRVTMQTRGSKFVKSQEIKLQEHSDQVPIGHIPRTITVLAHGELTRLANPGDHVSISGIFLPSEKTAYRARNIDAAADTYIEAHFITHINKTEDDELSDEPMSIEEAQQLFANSNNLLAKLSSSIAPEIYGHEELKKALLLLLVGGVDRNASGMKIRGNINICLMGDPGVAKSQLLSFIDRLASRSQYTTGRGSSGVGLTAAVLKDPVTEEAVLEGGALVLADGGICCIDEFDKMMDADRTAIHEVMEQQTVSIAKAGIMTTLNARVSILAAANPAYGRYNVYRSVTDNLNLPPALLSRFDLLWLIRDTPNMEKDLNLAQHITHIHSHPNDQPPSDHDAIDMKVMRRYINLCKLKDPGVPTNLINKLVDVYLKLRQSSRILDGDLGKTKTDTLFTSPRSLLAILRISTAFARLRLADVVEEADIAAAVSLYNASRESIEDCGELQATTSGKLIELLKKMTVDRDGLISLDEVKAAALAARIKEESIMPALEELNNWDAIWMEGGKIRLMDI